MLGLASLSYRSERSLEMDNGYSVVVEGGRPWGFSLQGGLEFRAPLRVGKVSGRRGRGGRARGPTCTSEVCETSRFPMIS